MTASISNPTHCVCKLSHINNCDPRKIILFKIRDLYYGLQREDQQMWLFSASVLVYYSDIGLKLPCNNNDIPEMMDVY